MFVLELLIDGHKESDGNFTCDSEMHATLRSHWSLQKTDCRGWITAEQRVGHEEDSCERSAPGKSGLSGVRHGQGALLAEHPSCVKGAWDGGGILQS